jgi:hypothetical protein
VEWYFLLCIVIRANSAYSKGFTGILFPSPFYIYKIWRIALISTHMDVSTIVQNMRRLAHTNTFGCMLSHTTVQNMTNRLRTKGFGCIIISLSLYYCAEYGECPLYQGIWMYVIPYYIYKICVVPYAPRDLDVDYFLCLYIYVKSEQSQS